MILQQAGRAASDPRFLLFLSDILLLRQQHLRRGVSGRRADQVGAEAGRTARSRRHFILTIQTMLGVTRLGKMSCAGRNFHAAKEDEVHLAREFSPSSPILYFPAGEAEAPLC